MRQTSQAVLLLLSSVSAADTVVVWATALEA